MINIFNGISSFVNQTLGLNKQTSVNVEPKPKEITKPQVIVSEERKNSIKVNIKKIECHGCYTQAQYLGTDKLNSIYDSYKIWDSIDYSDQFKLTTNFKDHFEYIFEITYLQNDLYQYDFISTGPEGGEDRWGLFTFYEKNLPKNILIKPTKSIALYRPWIVENGGKSPILNF